MALPAYALPYGLRDLKLRSISSSGVVSSELRLTSRLLARCPFAEAEAFDELRGDDIAFATHGNGPVVNWDLEGGGISHRCVCHHGGWDGDLNGHHAQHSRRHTPSSAQTRGRTSRSRARSSLTTVVTSMLSSTSARQLVTLVVTSTEGAFFLIGATGVGYPEAASKLYDFVHNETAAAIT
jgi:hypothetical protein